ITVNNPNGVQFECPEPALAQGWSLMTDGQLDRFTGDLIVTTYHTPPANSGKMGETMSYALTCKGANPIRLAQLRREHPLTVRSVAHAAYERGDKEIKATICFAETKTQFGGRRLWFVCPSCGGRCRVLFTWRWLMCRRCCDLRYSSQ